MLTSLLFASRPALAPVAFAGCFMLGAGAAFLSALLFSRTISQGSRAADDSRTAGLSGAVDPQRAAHGARSGPVVSEDRRHRHHGDLRRDVVAERVSEGRTPPPKPSRCARRRRPPRRADATALVDQGAAASKRARSRRAVSPDGSGHAIQPVFAPLGYDWQLSAGLLTSFLAREVFVSTMAVLAGAGDDQSGVISGVRTMRREDGRPVFTPATRPARSCFSCSRCSACRRSR